MTGSGMTPRQQELVMLAATLEAHLSEIRRELTSVTVESDAEREWRPRWISLKEALSLLGVAEKTAIRYATLHGIGHRPAGRWLFDENRIKAFQAGRPYPPLCL